jgi:CRISPR-associated protein Cas2
MSHLWMIAYDISNDKIRKMVHDSLLNHGQRVQFSVFECRLNPKQQQSLREKLAQLIEKQDSVRWYPLCNWCEADIHWQGEGKSIDRNEFYII